jgi:hypothetical protein
MVPLEFEQARLSGINELPDNQWPHVVSHECPGPMTVGLREVCFWLECCDQLWQLPKGLQSLRQSTSLRLCNPLMYSRTCDLRASALEYLLLSWGGAM